MRTKNKRKGNGSKIKKNTEQILKIMILKKKVSRKHYWKSAVLGIGDTKERFGGRGAMFLASL